MAAVENARPKTKNKLTAPGLDRLNCITHMALSAGDKLGPYEIPDRIGLAGMGNVYKARDTRLNRTVGHLRVWLRGTRS